MNFTTLPMNLNQFNGKTTISNRNNNKKIEEKVHERKEFSSSEKTEIKHGKSMMKRELILKSKELKKDEIIPLLSSPLKTKEIIERFMSNSKRNFTFSNDQTKVNMLKTILLERKEELVVFEGTYHNMLELYNGLKRKISDYLNERITNSSTSTSLKEKYLENHISKLEFTEIISRFGVLGRMENGSLKINVKKLPTLELLDRLGNFTVEQSMKIQRKSPSEIFIPIHTLISSIKSMDQWEKKGIELETLADEKITIHPHFGVYMPTRKELFNSLIKQSVSECINSKLSADNKKSKLEILDLGAGSGVFSIYVSKLISENIVDLGIKFVDINPWALECSKFNFENNFKSSQPNSVSAKYVQVDLTSSDKEPQPEIKSFLNSKDTNSVNLILCNPPWISIERKDYDHIQNERMKFGSFKNTIDLSIFDTDYEFLDQFLNLLQNSHNQETYGMLLVSNIGHLVGVEQVSILEALEKRIQGKNVKIEKVFTLKREQDSKQNLSVKSYLVNNPLASKRKKSPHQDIIQDTKSSEEVYCICLGKHNNVK